ncbi:MAG: acetyl-CoA C-acetyltransferase [Planctomycetes bacterium]|nr:acetyl-CoA C-acetyltransferase [Planctomycetota bacterium]
MSSSYIVSACRTPIGKFLGSLAPVSATELGSAVVREALLRSGLSAEDIDEVILGNVLSAGLGQAPARQAALGAGLPPTVAALTINKVCGSGLKAIMLADQAIRCGDADAIIAGGMESMSRAPHLLSNVRSGWKFGNQSAVDSMIHDGLWCPFEQTHMGASADYVASRYGVTREAQDQFALESHRRAVASTAAGLFDAEIVPVTVPGRKGQSQVIARDEGPRAETSIEALGKLAASFGGSQTAADAAQATVTAGNASQLSDGAAAVVVVNERRASAMKTPLKARIVAAATSGVAPREIFIAPVSAIEHVLAWAGLMVADIDLFELNEAFAAQTLACMAPLGLPPEKTNVRGGAIALGHPIGASGARVIVTLLYALAERGLKRGLASLCLGGGNAVAMIVERV